MRPLAAAALAALLGCAVPRASGPGAADAAILRAGELARVKCLVVAPFESASDVPQAANAATGALLGAIDPAQTWVFPVPDLRALFRDTPLELPEGVPPSLALELAGLLGADAALYGTVEGRSRDADPDLLVTLRLVLTTRRDLLFAATVPVRPAPGEETEAAVRRTVLEAARPMLARLGAPGRKGCFDRGRTEQLRALAMADARGPAPQVRPPPPVARPSVTATSTPPPPPPPPAPAVASAHGAPPPRTPRQSEWARRIAGRERFVVDDVAFAGRSSELSRDGGLSDLAAAIAAAPGVKVRIEGFVDATSDAAGDASLSQAMALIAVQRLVEVGVPRDRLAWAGHGGESPLLPNFTVRGRAANRRIEAVGLR